MTTNNTDIAHSTYAAHYALYTFGIVHVETLEMYHFALWMLAELDIAPVIHHQATHKTITILETKCQRLQKFVVPLWDIWYKGTGGAEDVAIA